MKRFLWTWLAAAAVVALAFFTVFDGQRLEKKEQETESKKAVVKLASGSITHIEIRTRTNTTVLEKDPAKLPEVAWRVTAPYQDEADYLAVETLLNQIEAEKSIKTVAEGAKLDLKAFGLDEPVTRLKLSGKDGPAVEVRIGSVRAYDGSLYAQAGDEPRVLLVSAGWDPMLAKLPKDFRNKQPLRNNGLKLAELKRIVLRPDAGSAFELMREGEKWQIKGAEGFPVDNEKVSQFFERIKDFRVHEFAEDEVAKRAKAALAKAQVSVALYKEAGEKPVFTMTLAADPASKSDEYFGQSSDLAMPVTMTRNAQDVFDKTAQDFYDRKLPFHFAAADVARIEVASAELKASFEKKADKWSLAPSDLHKKADSAKLDELVNRLSQMEAFRILAAKAADKFDSRVILKKADGAPVFELAWGAAEIEKASGHRPEARFLRALTKTSAEYRVGLSEGAIKSLGLAALVADETKDEAKPAKQASK